VILDILEGMSKAQEPAEPKEKRPKVDLNIGAPKQTQVQKNKED